MKYFILFVSIFFLLLSIESIWMSYVLIKGFLTVHIEQPIYFSTKLLVRVLMGGFFFYAAFLCFRRFNKW